MRKSRAFAPYLIAVLATHCGVPATLVAAPHTNPDRLQVTVTTTRAAGPGSLAHAIARGNAAAGGAIITFNIPSTDPAHDRKNGVWTISLDKPLPPLASSPR